MEQINKLTKSGDSLQRPGFNAQLERENPNSRWELSFAINLSAEDIAELRERGFYVVSVEDHSDMVRGSCVVFNLCREVKVRR